MILRKAIRAFRDSPAVKPVLVEGLKFLRQLPAFRGENLYRHVPYSGIVEVPVKNGRSFRVRARGGQIENRLYWDGVLGNEPGSMSTWLKRSATARTVLDIGANSGVFALAAAVSGAKSVHAFEPVKRIHEILKENIALSRLSNVVAWNCAVGQIDAIAEISDPGGDAPTSASLSSEFVNNHLSSVARIPVEVVAIDSWINRANGENVDLIKLDVEGYEEYALRGMSELVRRDRPVLLVEVLDEYEPRIRLLIKQLWGDSYHWHVIEEGNGDPNRNVLLTPRESER